MKETRVSTSCIVTGSQIAYEMLQSDDFSNTHVYVSSMYFTKLNGWHLLSLKVGHKLQVIVNDI